MTVFLCIFGSLTFTSTNFINHDLKYIIELSDEVDLNIPSDSYISITYAYKINCESLAMIKISSSAYNDFINELEGNSDWKKDTSFIPSYLLDEHVVVITENYDYYFIFNRDKRTYNDLDGKLIFMAFDVETRVLFLYYHK